MLNLTEGAEASIIGKLLSGYAVLEIDLRSFAR